MHTGLRSVAPWQPVRTWYSSASAAIFRSCEMPPACTTVVRMKSISCSVISWWQSWIELKTSPTAIGVVVCWRMRRKPSCSSAGTGSSIHNRRYGSRLLPTRAASIGVRRWWTSCSRCSSGPNSARTRSNSDGMKST